MHFPADTDSKQRSIATLKTYRDSTEMLVLGSVSSCQFAWAADKRKEKKKEIMGHASTLLGEVTLSSSWWRGGRHLSRLRSRTSGGRGVTDETRNFLSDVRWAAMSNGGACWLDRTRSGLFYFPSTAAILSAWASSAGQGRMGVWGRVLPVTSPDAWTVVSE